MISKSCIRVLKYEFEHAGIIVEEIDLGYANIKYDTKKISEERLIEILEDCGFELIKSRDEQIVEQTKIAVIELIHYLNNVDSIVRKSDYIVEKLGMSYQQISKLFSKYENITLEKYIILNKIERIKELILSEEYTLSEISYMMDYNSVQYLSNQFKKIAGISVSEFKQMDKPPRTAINELIKIS